MWALVAQAIGFLVVRMRWADPGFAKLMQGYEIQAKISKLGKFWVKPQNIKIVFGDMESLGPPRIRSANSAEYWKQWACPHFPHYPEGGEDPPSGLDGNEDSCWPQARGGSTDAVLSLVLWSPPGRVALPLVSVPAQPWVPLLARVNRGND